MVCVAKGGNKQGKKSREEWVLRCLYRTQAIAWAVVAKLGSSRNGTGDCAIDGSYYILLQMGDISTCFSFFNQINISVISMAPIPWVEIASFFTWSRNFESDRRVQCVKSIFGNTKPLLSEIRFMTTCRKGIVQFGSSAKRAKNIDFPFLMDKICLFLYHHLIQPPFKYDANTLG